MTINEIHVGNRLKEIRKYRGYSSAEVTAFFLRINRVQYSRYESGKNMSKDMFLYILSQWGINEETFLSSDPISFNSFTNKSVSKDLVDCFKFLIKQENQIEYSKLMSNINEDSRSYAHSFSRVPTHKHPFYKASLAIYASIRYKDAIFLYNLFNKLKFLPDHVASFELFYYDLHKQNLNEKLELTHPEPAVEKIKTIVNLREEFESTGYATWINSELYPDGKIYTKEYTEWLEQQVLSLRLLTVASVPVNFRSRWPKTHHVCTNFQEKLVLQKFRSGSQQTHFYAKSMSVNIKLDFLLIIPFKIYLI